MANIKTSLAKFLTELDPTNKIDAGVDKVVSLLQKNIHFTCVSDLPASRDNLSTIIMGAVRRTGTNTWPWLASANRGNVLDRIKLRREELAKVYKSEEFSKNRQAMLDHPNIGEFVFTDVIQIAGKFRVSEKNTHHIFVNSWLHNSIKKLTDSGVNLEDLLMKENSWVTAASMSPGLNCVLLLNLLRGRRDHCGETATELMRLAIESFSGAKKGLIDTYEMMGIAVTFIQRQHYDMDQITARKIAEVATCKTGDCQGMCKDFIKVLEEMKEKMIESDSRDPGRFDDLLEALKVINDRGISTEDSAVEVIAILADLTDDSGAKKTGAGVIRKIRDVEMEGSKYVNPMIIDKNNQKNTRFEDMDPDKFGGTPSQLSAIQKKRNVLGDKLSKMGGALGTNMSTDFFSGRQLK